MHAISLASCMMLSSTVVLTSLRVCLDECLIKCCLDVVSIQ